MDLKLTPKSDAVRIRIEVEHPGAKRCSKCNRPEVWRGQVGVDGWSAGREQTHDDSCPVWRCPHGTNKRKDDCQPCEDERHDCDDPDCQRCAHLGL